jgi:hypothetical protein
VNAQLRSQHVPDKAWYLKKFFNYGNAHYCAAIDSNIYDKTICGEDNKAEDDPAKIAFTRAYQDIDGHPTFHMMDFKAGDRWQGRLWGCKSNRLFKKA